jgi:hypothetical protein
MAAGRLSRVLAFFLLAAVPAFAHVGTSSVFTQGKAGPYAVYVTVVPPAVIPGEAQISVLSDDPALQSVSAQANVLAGESARNMPEGLLLQAGPVGSHEFHGTVWIMTQGSWQVRLTAAGAKGSGALAVPLPASPVRLMHMSKGFGGLLIVLGLFLVAAVAAIASAALREAAAEPGSEPTAADSRHGRIAAVVAVLLIGVLLLVGNMLWREEITRYTQNIYQPLDMTPTLSGATSSSTTLHLRLRPPSTAQEIFSSRRLDDLVLDHNHLMHLYVVRWPEMSVVYHLHPAQVSAGDFDLALPAFAAGNYRLFADIVHADGFPETAVADVYLDVPKGTALAGDDAYGELAPFPQAAASEVPLADGYRFRFAVESPEGKGEAIVRANSPVVLRFTLLDPQGNAPSNMENYMGMLGHLAIIRSDGSVFAHIHPEGSAAMAAMMMANAAAGSSMDMSPAKLSNTADFPFGFPNAGRYRIVIQMKHGATIETAATDLTVR